MILLDTNVVVYSINQKSQVHDEVTQRLRELSESHQLIVCPQVIYEFYVFLTRPPENNGFGLSNSEADEHVEEVLSVYKLLGENGEVFKHWQVLVSKFAVKGKSVHDTRIIAFMKEHEIEKLYTYNRADFNRYSSIIQLI